MIDYRLVPVDPTPEMVEAAEDAYMPFGDMEMAIRMALLAAPDVQGEPVYLYRRLGLHDFVTCNHDRYAELSVKPHLFETKVLYTAPQPAERQPDVTQLVEAAAAALDEIEKIMHEAYNSAEPVCCGGFGAEGCCGSPEPEWSEHDQNTMDRLAPHQRALTAALAAYRKGGDTP